VGARRVLAYGPCWNNFRYASSSRICVPNPNIIAFILFQISAFIRTDWQTDLAISTRLVILIKYIYTLRDRKRFLLTVTYFPTNPFTLRVTDIKIDLMIWIAWEIFSHILKKSPLNFLFCFFLDGRSLPYRQQKTNKLKYYAV